MNQTPQDRIPRDDPADAEHSGTTAVEADQDDSRCDCEYPGYFYSGVPGILARVENGRLATGATVERCDLCHRYPSDSAALAKLQEMGIA